MTEWLTKKTSSPLPFPCYFWTVAVICLLGLAVAVSLSVSHYRLFTDPAYSSFCAISKSINCDTVSQSPYAVLWGVPVAAWGVLAYLTFLLLLLLSLGHSAHHQRVWTLLFSMALGFSGYSLVLAAISTYVIGSYCILCIALYAVNLLLLFFSWIVRRRFNSEPFFRALGKDLRHLSPTSPLNALILAGILAAAAGVKAAYPAYWLFNLGPMPAQIATGVTPEGRPWIGAVSPALEIIEFADYQCFQCKKMYHHIRNLIAKYPEKIRLVHVHFPMDHEVQPNGENAVPHWSGKMALLVYAADEGKFWDARPALPVAGNRQEIDLHELASKSGLPAERLAESREARDSEGSSLPTSVWGCSMRSRRRAELSHRGKVYQGAIARKPSGDCRLMNGVTWRSKALFRAEHLLSFHGSRRTCWWHSSPCWRVASSFWPACLLLIGMP
jgi:uncharacterized membrane protein